MYEGVEADEPICTSFPLHEVSCDGQGEIWWASEVADIPGGESSEGERVAIRHGWCRVLLVARSGRRD